MPSKDEALVEALQALIAAAQPYRPDSVDFVCLSTKKMREACNLDAAIRLCEARLNPDPEGRVWGTITGGNYKERGWFDGVVRDGNDLVPCVTEARRGVGWTLQDVGFYPDDPAAFDAALATAVAAASTKREEAASE